MRASPRTKFEQAPEQSLAQELEQGAHPKRQHASRGSPAPSILVPQTVAPQIAANWGTVGPMKCPGCASDMVQVELHSIEIDRCPACGGIVLDKGESEAIDALGLAHTIEGGVSADHAHDHPRTTVARCYECVLDMIELRGAGDVEYDWCEGCERLFFDRGELTAFDAFVDV